MSGRYEPIATTLSGPKQTFVRAKTDSHFQTQNVSWGVQILNLLDSAAT